MGACGGKVSNEEKVALAIRKNSSVLRNADKKLDELMRKEGEEALNEINLLLLGAGESGKSTFRKQMRIIHSAASEESIFTEEEMKGFVKSIYKNIFEGLGFLIRAVSSHGDIKLDPETRDMAEEIEIVDVDDDDKSTYDERMAEYLSTVWASPAIQKIVSRLPELKLYNVNVNIEALKYYMEHIKRVCHPNYVPDQQDILNARVQTITVEEEIFTFKGSMVRMIDVGGQRNERKKWLPLFENVTCFLFFASLVTYDEHLAEAKDENRMLDSLQIFGAVVNYHAQDDPPPLILFLNKKDLLEKKAVTVDLKCCFPEYTGGLNYDNCLDYIKMKFLEQNRSVRKVYVIVTCATSTKNIRFVFKTCGEIILKENLKKSGMYNQDKQDSFG